MFRYLRFAVIGLTFLVSACEADQVEIKLNRKDIETALSGGDPVVHFQAIFSQYGKITDEQRSEIDSLKTAVKEFVEIEEFNLETTEERFTVSLSGKLPLSMKPQPRSAWYIQIEPYAKMDGYHLISLKASEVFEALAKRSEAINPMMAPDRFHPTKFTVDATGMRILAPAVEVNGNPELLFDEVLDGAVSITFRGGVFEQTGAGFLFSLK